MEDRPTGKAVWKKEDPAVLRAEVEAKERAAMEAKTKASVRGMAMQRGASIAVASAPWVRVLLAVLR